MAARYRVGRGKPPRETRFKKGQSGNPAGRPKNRRNLATELNAELQESVTVREGGVARKVSKKRGLLKSMMARSLQGDVRAGANMIALIERLEDQRASETIDIIDEDEVATLRRYLPQLQELLGDKKGESDA